MGQADRHEGRGALQVCRMHRYTYDQKGQRPQKISGLEGFMKWRAIGDLRVQVSYAPLFKIDTLI